MVKIKVYSQPMCNVCHDLKEYLTTKGVEFEDLDITANRDALNEMIKEHRIRTVPLLVAGDRKSTGFNPAEVDAIISGLEKVEK